MSYHITVLYLCEIFGSLAPPAAESGGLRLVQPKELALSAIESVASLILLYRATHGWKSMPVVMMHYLVIVAVHSVDRLKILSNSDDGEPANQHRWRKVLATCVSGLWYMNTSWPFCRFFLRAIQHVLQSSGLSDVPPDVETIFGELDSKVWTPTTAKSLSSGYMIHQLPDSMLSEEGGGVNQSRATDTYIGDMISALDSVSIA